MTRRIIAILSCYTAAALWTIAGKPETGAIFVAVAFLILSQEDK